MSENVPDQSSKASECRMSACVVGTLSLLYAAWLYWVLYVCALRFEIPWDNSTLLDRLYLESAPWVSVLYLHAQPPLMNLLTAGVLKASEMLSLEPTTVASALFAALGLMSVLFTYYLASEISDRRPIALAVVVAMLSNPGFAYFQQLYFYEFPAMATIVAVLAAGNKYLHDNSKPALMLLAVALVTLSLWKALFHPVVEITLFVIFVMGAALVNGERIKVAVRKSLWPSLILIAGLTAWPLKNWLLFGQFESSSLSAFNLSYRFPIPMDKDLDTFISSGRLSDAMKERMSAMSSSWPTVAAKQVTEGLKPSSNAVNWNNAIFLLTADSQRREALRWRRQHFWEWLYYSAGQYFMATRATFVFPYTGGVWPVGNDLFIGWETIYRDTLFFDLRPYFERWFPDSSIHRSAILRGQKVAYSLFAIVLPFLVVATLVRLLRTYKSLAAVDVLATAALTILLWVILIPVLTDGAEANRMRFGTCPLIGLLELYVVARRRETV